MPSTLKQKIVAVFIGGVLLPLSLVAPAAAESSEGDGGSKETYVEFEPLSVTILQNTRPLGILTVSFVLATSDPLLVDKIERLRTRVRSEVHQQLARLAATRISPGRPINVQLVAIFLQAAVDQIFGEHAIDVLIQLAAIRLL